MNSFGVKALQVTAVFQVSRTPIGPKTTTVTLQNGVEALDRIVSVGYFSVTPRPGLSVIVSSPFLSSKPPSTKSRDKFRLPSRST